MFKFQEVQIFEESELKNDVKNWINSKVNYAKENWESPCRPTTPQLFGIVEEIINDEILACEKADNIDETDYDFFIKCKKELVFIRVRTLLYARFDESYISVHDSRYCGRECKFIINKHYRKIWSSLMEELVEIIGFNFGVEFIDRYNCLAIVVDFHKVTKDF